MNPGISRIFLFVLILLSLVSLLVIFSVAPDRLPQQTAFLLFGFAFFLYLRKQSPGVWQIISVAAYLLTIALLLFTLIFGESIRGSLSWIKLLGTQLQASEIAKPLLIISYAGFITKWKPSNLKNLLINASLALLPISLILLQPDLGTATVHFAIWLTMILVGGITLPFVTLGLLSFVAIIFSLPRFLKDYQITRLTVFLDPTADPLGAGYNVIQSMIAIGSGQILGKGLGRGTQSQLRFLPERHTDFIFASFAEEFGLVGSIALIALFTYVLVILLALSSRVRTLYSRLVLTGVFTYLFFQTFLNIAINLGIAPVTGITLPLISSGGSSIIATFAALGIAWSCSRDLKPSMVLEIR